MSEKVKVLGKLVNPDPIKIYNRFLKKAKEEGHDHSGIDVVVRNKFVATEAEVEAAKMFFSWVLEDIGTNYKVIGGKTYRAGEDMLFPAGLPATRCFNMHLWEEYKHVN